MTWIDHLVARPDVHLNTRSEPLPVAAHSPHAVVVGAGLGGLAAAVRLGVRGFRVTLLERLDQPGGRARVFRQDGFTFDAGPTVVTAPFLFEELWWLCGRRFQDDIELRPIHPFYRVRFDDGVYFDYSGDAAAMEAEVARFSPADVAGYRRFMEQSAEVFRIGFEALGHVPFDRLSDMARIVPAMIALQSYRTVYSLVSKYVRHPQLRQVFSFHPLLIGGNPFTITSIYSLIPYLERRWGIHYAMGGTGTLVRGLVGLVEGLGGELRLNAEVTEILLDGHRACGLRLASGETVRADLVVCDGDVAWTYRYLVPEHARRRWNNRRLERTKYSMSLFVWYFGTRRQYPEVAHHTILLGPRYRGLLDDIFLHRKLADDFSLYLHRPTATDPSVAPPGCDAFYALAPVPHLDAGVDWRECAEPYRQAISRYLSDSLLPGLEENLATSRMFTPQGFLRDYLAFKGSAFSVEPLLTQSAYFRPHNRSEDVEHLYFVGAGTHPGAGMPGVLSSARVLDTVVPDAEDFLKSGTD